MGNNNPPCGPNVKTNLAILLFLTLTSASHLSPAVTPVIPQLLFDGSSDISLSLSGTFVNDEDIASDTFTPPPMVSMFANVPVNADIVALARLSNGDSLVTFDITISLPGAGGNIVATPQDVVRASGGIYSLEYDGRTNGLTNGVRIDAVSEHPSGLLMSFDISTKIGSLVVDDADVVLWDGAVHAILFDAASAGIPASYDIDAIHYASVLNRFHMSFKTSGSLDGQVFADEDIIEHDIATGDFTLALDTSVLHAEWASANLDALSLNTDSDNDGLGDTDESLLGTQPLDSDSDDDGLLDGVETNTLDFLDENNTGTDPLKEDTDNDGILDGDEVANGTDPTDASDPGTAPIQIPTLPRPLVLMLIVLTLVTSLACLRHKNLITDLSSNIFPH